jgi:DNA repair photolyase
MNTPSRSQTNGAHPFSVTPPPSRALTNEKPVIPLPRKTILSLKSKFEEKLLCDGPTFSVGNASAHTRTLGRKGNLAPKRGVEDTLKQTSQPFRDMVVRHPNAASVLRAQLLDVKGYPKYCRDEDEGRVIYSSSVDVAANPKLVRETVELVKLILAFTRWDIRLLSKSSLLPRVAERLGDAFGARRRVIYGVSIGTLEDKLAAAFEIGTTKVSKRLESLHHLQDAGFRTFGMISPVLPQFGYDEFASDMAEDIRVDQCEHVWVEPINVRGESFSRTAAALSGAGFWDEAAHLAAVCGPGRDEAREEHAREAFELHTQYIPGHKLRFLHYPSLKALEWWQGRAQQGAVLLGNAAFR